MILAPIHEYNRCHEPGGKPSGGEFCSDPEGETTVLYRGDATTISTFALERANPASLFGAGIYLTTNRRVASDYTAKDATVLFRYGGSAKSTKQDAIDAYIRRNIAPYIDAQGQPLPGDEGRYGRELPSMVGDPEREARLAAARKKWETEIAPTVEIRKLVGNDIVFRQRGKTGAISTYDVPKTWISKTLDAETEISEKVAAAIYNVMKAHTPGYYRTKPADDVYQFATTPDEDGFRPTFREVYHKAALAAASNAWEFMEPAGQLALRRELKALGYKGIRYAGGVTMGAGPKHNAYVFWDEQGLKKRKRP